MKKNRGSWGSNFGFIMAAVGSAVGLGNIWGFPYKMGKSGGFTFLIIYLALAVIVGLTVMAAELALGRKTGTGVVGAYQKISKTYKWIGWLGILSPFLIMSFYAVLGGYCIQYMSLNLAELSFGLQNIFGQTVNGSNTFSSMLTNPVGCCLFTLLFMLVCMLIVKGGISGGIEKFNKIGMPALFVMLVIIIIRSVTLPNAAEGLKFMFVPGYALKAGFITEAPSFISVLATAGGQMFFSLSLAMGVMITYGSYLGKHENLVSNSTTIVIADTAVALCAGLAVIPAAVGNGISNGIAVGDIALGGPKLLFVTLQDVFSNMGTFGALFGIIFYALVIIAAISSAISLMEVVATYFIDRAEKKGKEVDRTTVTIWISVAITVEALLVAWDGLGSNGVWVPFQHLFAEGLPMFCDCWLDFMDCWSEGIMMPLGAMLMALMVGWELRPKFVLDEIHSGESSKFFDKFFFVCIKYLVPIIMAFILAGQIIDFFSCPATEAYIQPLAYAIAGVLLVFFFLISLIGKRRYRNKPNAEWQDM